MDTIKKTQQDVDFLNTESDELHDDWIYAAEIVAVDSAVIVAYDRYTNERIGIVNYI